jgi:hypothetical protein
MQEPEVPTDTEQQQHTTQPDGDNVAGVAAEAQAQDALTEEDIAFATWALQLGGYLRSLLETDPSAAIAEFESAAQFLRQLTTGDTPSFGQPAQQESHSAEPDALEEMIQNAVERALAQKMKKTLWSPSSLQGTPPSARRLADLIE